MQGSRVKQLEEQVREARASQADRDDALHKQLEKLQSAADRRDQEAKEAEAAAAELRQQLEHQSGAATSAQASVAAAEEAIRSAEARLAAEQEAKGELERACADLRGQIKQLQREQELQQTHDQHSLKEQKETLQARMRLQRAEHEAEVAKLQAALQSAQSHAASDQAASSQQLQARLDQVKSEHAATVEGLQQRLRQVQDVAISHERTAKEAEAAAAELRQQLEHQSGAATSAQVSVAAAEEAVRSAEARLAAEQEAKGELERTCADLRGQIKQLQREQELQHQGMQLKSKEHDTEMQAQRMQLEAEVAKLQAALQSAQSHAASDQAASSQQLQARLDQVKSEHAATVEGLQQRLRQVQDVAISHERTAKEAEAAAAELRQQLEHQSGAATSAQASVAAAEEAVRSAEARLAAEQEAKGELERTCADLRGQLQAAAASSSDVAELEEAREQVQAAQADAARLSEQLSQARSALSAQQAESAQLLGGMREELDEHRAASTKRVAAAEQAAATARQELERVHSQARSEAVAAEQRLEAAAKEHACAVEALETELAAERRGLAESKAALEEAAERSEALKGRAEAAEAGSSRLQTEVEELCAAAAAAEAAARDRFEEQDRVHAADKAAWERQTQADVTAAATAATEAAAARWQPEVAAAQAARDELHARWKAEAARRRQAHHKLIDLQGNIRVFARVRPILPVEEGKGAGAALATAALDDELIEVAHSGRGGGMLKRQCFEFDRTFSPSSRQEEVFQEVEPVVTSVLDGFNSCIFAYGQTGSGKTYTMEGSAADPGVNRRALRRLFELLSERGEAQQPPLPPAGARGAPADLTQSAAGAGARPEEDAAMQLSGNQWMGISVLEIHNESIRDLLTAATAPTGRDAGFSSRSAAADKQRSLDIRRDRSGNTVVLGLTVRPVRRLSEVEAAMAEAAQRRSVGAHDMNEHSSRSHLVVTVHLECDRIRSGDPGGSRRGRGGERVQAKLHLIDLAGSERVGKTAATGARLKEAQHINKSLSALGDVMHALAGASSGGSGGSGGGHIPFRNSKLTHLLQDSLSQQNGGSKVLMFVNVSPAQYNAHESLCSLQFAARCRAVKLGQAKRVVMGEAAADGAALRRRVATLERQLEAARAR